MLYVVCCLLFVVYRLKEKISLLDLDYSHRTMFKWGVHPGLFFSPFQDPVSSIIFWGTNRFPNWVVFAVGPLKVFDRMGDQAKIHISLNVSLQNTWGRRPVPRPLFLPRAFSQQRSGNWHHKRHRFAFRNFGIDCLVPWYEFVRSAYHGFVPKNSGKWAKFAPEFAPVNFPKNGLAPAYFPNLVKFNRVYSGGLAPMWICCRFDSHPWVGSKKLDVWKYSWFDSQLRAGSKKLDFFQNVPGSIPNCGGIDQIVFSKCSWFDSQLRRNWLNRRQTVCPTVLQRKRLAITRLNVSPQFQCFFFSARHPVSKKDFAAMQP